MPFLQKIVDDISIQQKDLRRLRHHCYVFPTRRAGIYFKKHLTDRFKRQFIWSPLVLSIMELTEYLTDQVLLDPVTMVLELYKIYQKYEPEVRFDKFYPWGQLIVQDFNDIDKYLVDAEQLFSNLKDVKEVDELFAIPEEELSFLKLFWRVFEKEEVTEVEQEFIRIWEILGKVYQEFKLSLQTQNAAYEGMAQRSIIERLESGDLVLPFDKIVFAGFNALTKTEEQILSFFTKNYPEKTKIYWDTDVYYMTNKTQEAGKFMRNYQAKWPDLPHDWSSQTDLTQASKNLHLIGVPLQVGQAKYVGQLLQNIVGEEEKQLKAAETALVLGDEGLLFPMLHALPENIETVNITMGYPLKNNPLYHLLETIVQLQKTSITTELPVDDLLIQHSVDPKPDTKIAFYSKFILQILNNPFIQPFAKEEIQQYMAYIARNNLLYIYGSTIQERLTPPIFKLIFRKADHFQPLIETFNDLLVLLFHQIKNGYTDAVGNEAEDINAKPDEVWTDKTPTNDSSNLLTNDSSNLPNNDSPNLPTNEPKTSIELEFIYHLLKQLRKLEETLNKYRQRVELDTFWRLFREIIQSVKLPFTGEPLRGLQIMGFLSTWTLDFKNVFVLGLNEGNIPSSRQVRSFIPFHLRKAFGLPTFLDQDAIYAYHFYHLLQRSENIYLLYNTEVGKLGSGEKSRFVLQLEHELARFPNINIHHQIVTTAIQAQALDDSPLAIPKTEAVMDRLNRYLSSEPQPEEQVAKKLAPSALALYINDPVQFYFRYIAELYEIEAVDEDINPIIFGNILHKTIELLYKPYQKSLITEEVIGKILGKKRKITTALNRAFKEEKFNHHREGKNLLLKKVIHRLVIKILKNDQTDAPFQIIGLEAREYATELNIGNGRTVGITGIIDRVDQVVWEGEKVYRVLDYKTGNIRINDSARALTLDFDRYLNTYFEKPDYKSGFQAYLYSYLFWLQKKQEQPNIVAGIYAVRFLNKGIKYLRNGELLTDEFFEAFEKQLKSMLIELFDAETPFLQSEEEKRYEYSPYKGLVL